MSLRKITLLVVAITMLGLVGVLSLTLQYTLVPRFLADERRGMEADLQRLQGVILNEHAYLGNLVKDWGKWDNTYNFIENGDPAYIQANLNPSTFSGLQINVIAFINRSGQVIYGQSFDLSSNQLEPLPASLKDLFTPGSPLLNLTDAAESEKGLLMLPEGPLLVDTHQILRTSGEGPARGVILAGRYLSTSTLNRLSKLINLPIQVFPFADSGGGPALQAARTVLSLTNPVFVGSASGTNLMSGYLLLPDLSGKPGLILQIDESPQAHRDSTLVTNYILIAVISASLTFGVMIIILLDQTVISKVTRLSQEVRHIGTTGDISLRVNVSGMDELTQLGRMINQTLNDLEQAQLRRSESENRFRILVDSIDNLVYSIDSDLIEVSLFGHWLERYDLPAGILAGRAVRGAGDEDAAALHLEANQKVLKDGQQTAFSWSVTGEGGVHHFRTSLAPLMNTRKEIYGIAGVVSDVTSYIEMDMALRGRLQDLDGLYEASQTLLSQIETPQTLNDFCRQVTLRFGLCKVWLGRYEKKSGRIIPLGSSYKFAEPLADIQMNGIEANLVKEAILAGEPRVGKLAVLAAEPAAAGPVPEDGIRSVAILPLSHRDEMLGALTLFSDEDDYFTPERLQLFSSFANLAEMALQNNRLFEQVRAGRERLKLLSRQLVEVQEAERRQVAMELHDEIGQTITGLKIMVDVVARSHSSSGVPQELSEAQVMVNELIGQVREMSLDLRPAMLDDLGLLPAFVWHFDRYTRRTGIKVDFAHTGLDGQRFPQEIETAAYRVIQEALTNVARHAGVNEAGVSVWKGENYLGLQVEDHGKGFDPVQMMGSNRSRGLVGMQERVTLLGGFFTIESSSGHGTRLIAELPLMGYLERRNRER